MAIQWAMDGGWDYLERDYCLITDMLSKVSKPLLILLKCGYISDIQYYLSMVITIRYSPNISKYY